MKYLAVLGRQPEISIAELEALGFSITGNGSCPNSFFSGRSGALAQVLGPSKKELRPSVSKIEELPIDINRLGGVLKLAVKLEQRPLEFLQNLPDGKITLGLSDYSKNATKNTASREALKLKKILARHGRSMRVVSNKEAVLSTATSLHNSLGGKNQRKVELIKVENDWYKVIGVQDIDTYAKRDQARPARDARVGMLPPKLAQILINLCGPLKPSSVILDPFCGTGVVLQEALLMGYRAYGTDINERMIEYSKKNLQWLEEAETVRPEGIRRLASRGQAPAARGDGPAGRGPRADRFRLSQGDAMSFIWQQPINAVACEAYLGKPFSKIPSEIELKAQKQECSSIILGFFKNLASQIKKNTPVVIAIPAWLREDGQYERLDLLDQINNMGYNVDNKSQKGLLYCREGQIVARDIIILRKT